MTVTMEELGRRAAACKAWPGYTTGMADIGGYRVVALYDDGSCRVAKDEYAFDTATIADPDLSDRSTLAMMRDIVARAYGGTQAVVAIVHAHEFNETGCCVSIYDDERMVQQTRPFVCESQWPAIEALVCALEHAPASSSPTTR